MLDQITHLFRLKVIIEEGSLRRAAQKLNITQPALSRSMQRLERHYGRKLFERHSRGVTATAAGARVMSSTLRLARHWELAEAELLSAGGALHGRLRLRSGPLYRAVVLPKLIGQLQAVYPGIVIEMQNAQTTDAIRDLTEGRCDIIFGGLQIADNVDKRLVVEQFTVVRDRVVARENHPLFQRLEADGTADPEILLEYPWLIYTADPVYANATVHAPLESIGRSPDVRITCESLITALGLLQHSDCLCILPDAAVAETRSPQIVPVPVALSRRTVRSGAIYRAEMEDWPPLATLVELCRKRFVATGGASLSNLETLPSFEFRRMGVQISTSACAGIAATGPAVRTPSTPGDRSLRSGCSS